jgi:hypothetical protein
MGGARGIGTGSPPGGPPPYIPLYVFPPGGPHMGGHTHPNGI